MKKILLTIAALVLIGAGCQGTQADTTETENPANNAPVLTELQQAYANCIKQGYKATLKFDESESRLRLFCIFEDNTSCEAIAFMEDACEEQDPTKTYQTDEKNIIEKIENETNTTNECDNTVAPVCGQDGFTYSNACIATSQEVSIRHTGACADVQRLLDEDEQSQPESAGNPPDEIITKNPNLSWLNHLKTFAQNDNSITPIHIKECSAAGGNVYFKTGDFSTLYNDEGKILCFPSNDLRDFCPPNFERTCTTIWSK